MLVLTQEKALIFRITHIDNLPWLLENGVHSRNSDQRDPNFREIGNPDLIDKRNLRAVQIPPHGTLSDYVPFYFTPHSPMLLNIKTGYQGMRQTPMPQIAIMVSSLPSLQQHGVPFVFTDRHAYLTTARYSGDMKELNRIDWPLLQSRDFKRSPDDPGKMERYQAEVLVHRQLPVKALLGIACHGAEQETSVRSLVQQAGLEMSVVSRPGWYF